MFLFAIAHAQESGGDAQAGPIASFLPIILIFVVFYFLLIRPQQKRVKEHKQLLSSLAVGDEVMTNGGIIGKIIAIDAQVVTLDLGDSKVRFQRQSIQNILPKGTIQS